MNFKKTLVLAVVLVGAVLYLTKVSEPRRQAELTKDKLLVTVTESATRHVTISQKGDGSFSLTRLASEPTGSEWSMDGLVGARLDTSNISTMLAALRDATFEGPIAERELSTDFSIYGLDAPIVTFTIDMNEGTQKEIAFGKKSEYLGKRYAKVSGVGGVFLIDESSFASINKGRNDIRSKTPISFSDADVREVVIESSAGRVALSQPALGEWKVTEPVQRDASKDAVERLLLAARSLSVDEFIDGHDSVRSSHGLDAPSTTMTVTFREGLKDRRLRVAVKDGDDASDAPSYFTFDGAPSVFKTSREKTIPLRKGLLDLRDRRLVKLGPQELEKVVSGGAADAAVEIKASNTDWSVNGKVSDPVFVEQLLNDIVALEAVDYPTVVPTDAFASPFLTLSLTKKGGVGETTVLYVGNAVAGSGEASRYVKVNENGEVGVIRDVEAKRIVPHEGALLQRPTPSAPAVVGAEGTKSP